MFKLEEQFFLFNLQYSTDFIFKIILQLTLRYAVLLKNRGFTSDNYFEKNHIYVFKNQ